MNVEHIDDIIGFEAIEPIFQEWIGNAIDWPHYGTAEHEAYLIECELLEE